MRFLVIILTTCMYFFLLSIMYGGEFAMMMFLGLCVTNMWAAFIAEK